MSSRTQGGQASSSQDGPNQVGPNQVGSNQVGSGQVGSEPASYATDHTRQVEALDALYCEAGLVRHRRGSKSNVLRAARESIRTPEELRPALNGVEHRARNGSLCLSVPAWESESWLWHGFSTRQGGVSQTYCGENAAGELNLGFTAEDEAANVAENRRRLAEAVTSSRATPLAVLRQIHSHHIVDTGSAAQVSRVARGGDQINSQNSQGEREDTAAVNDIASKIAILARGDGLMTDQPGVLLAIQTADCVPVLVADRRRKVVAAFHAGWRGTVGRIVESGIGRMRLKFGSAPEDLIAAVGPAIGPCCYAVGEEVLSEFESQFSYYRELIHEVYETDSVRTRYPMLFLTQRAPGHSEIGPALHLDLAAANRRQLLDAGVLSNAIQMMGGCTRCDREMFFSHRGSDGRAGRMMSVIGIQG